MNPKIFNEITGNTHGIKFKIMPPMKPKSRNVKMPRTGAGGAVETIDGLVTCHAARSSPFGCWEKTTRPGMEDKFFPDDSIGIRKTISFLFRDSILGCPTTVACSGNGKKSGDGYLASVSLVIFRRRSDTARPHSAVATFAPGQLCGSKRRYRSNNSVFAASLVVDIGNSKFKVAFPGMQIFSQTSQLASATSLTVELSTFGGGVISCTSRTSFSYPYVWMSPGSIVFSGIGH